MLWLGCSDDRLHLTWITKDPSKGDGCRCDLVFFRQVIEDVIEVRKRLIADKISLEIAMLEDRPGLNHRIV